MTLTTALLVLAVWGVVSVMVGLGVGWVIKHGEDGDKTACPARGARQAQTTTVNTAEPN